MKPIVVISACLDGFAYRYNGSLVNDETIKKIKKLFNLIHVCPEFEIGLGVPRKIIKLYKTQNEIRAIQDKTKRDLTQELENFAINFLKNLNSVHGFILKAKSPSCGIGNAKIYLENNTYGKNYGIFAKTIKEKLPYIPLIDEERLKNKKLMREFLTKVFILFKFDKAKCNINSLIEFHKKYKYLFVSISKKHLKNLERIIAQYKSFNFDEIIKKYEREFKKMIKQSFKRIHNEDLLDQYLSESFLKL